MGVISLQLSDTVEFAPVNRQVMIVKRADPID
jgi:hypothetical protein